jgi:cobalt-precorrin 5A hydrolase/precorrin-3B C17-methyltransferase
VSTPRGAPPEREGIVIGLGFSIAATADEVSKALATALKVANCAWSDVVEVATLESRRGHPALGCLAGQIELHATDDPDTRSETHAISGHRVVVRFHSAAALAGVRTPNPSTAVARAIGIASVAEAAALASSGAHELIVPKRCTPRVCTAVATVRRLGEGRQ